MDFKARSGLRLGVYVLLCLGLLLSACQLPVVAPLATSTASLSGTQGELSFQIQASKYNSDLQSLFEKMTGELKTALNQRFQLPRDIDVSFQDCGTPDAYYVKGQNQVVMCSEFFLLMEQRFSEDDSLAIFRFVFLHELSHALIDQLQLPILGKEEDAADAMATVLLLDEEKDSRAALLAAISFYDLYQSGVGSSWADNHSIGPQRMFNLVCWAAGGQPEVLKIPLVAALYKEAQDSDRDCQAEYQQQKAAVDQLLGAHQTEPKS